MNRCKYKVWCPADGELKDRDAREIEEYDVESAAEEWADRDDCESAEYRIVGGTPVEVMVRDLATGKLTRCEVNGESVPQYIARTIKDCEGS
jgi:hypothetical protein